MQRSELSTSDEDVVKIVAKIWSFSAQYIEFIDVGCTFAFRLVSLSGEKYFLKIYIKSKPSDPVENVTPASLQRTCAVLDRLRAKHNLVQIPMIAKTSDGEYFHEENDLILMLSSYLEGSHASSRYDITGTSSKQLAELFAQLHSVPASEYPEIKPETFNIDYALGIEKWLNSNNIVNIEDKDIRQKIAATREGLYKCIETLKSLQIKFSNLPLEFVLTHGDAHHCNVLQNELEVFLIDWDNIKIGPRERDLWFYELASVINDYLELNPNLKINHDLCLYYQTQRFLEDLRIAIETNDLQSFIDHWGWIECYERINN